MVQRDMVHGVLISSCMTPLPHTVGSEQTIAFAQKLMNRYKIYHLPVLHGGMLYGIVSDRDLSIVSSLQGIDPNETTVEEAMTQEAYKVGRDTPLLDVLREMNEHKYGSAIVVTGVEVVGIFTMHDAVRILADYLAST